MLRSDVSGAFVPQLGITKAFLLAEYCERCASMAAIAAERGCSGTTISYWLKKYGIERRPIGSHRIGKGQRLTGRRVGRLTVLQKVAKDAWLTRCDCGRDYRATGFRLRNNKVYECHECRHPTLGHGAVQQAAWMDVVRGARKRQLSVTVTVEYVADLFEKQQRRCALSGVELQFALTRRGHVRRRETTASLDRIDAARPYEPGNVQWVHKIVNIMKGELSDSAFREWCQRIAVGTG